NNARIYVPPPVNNGNVSTPVTLEMIFVITSADPIVEIDPNVVTASREFVLNESLSTSQVDTLTMQLKGRPHELVGKSLKNKTALYIKDSAQDSDFLCSFGTPPESVISHIDLDLMEVSFEDGSK
ncbi:hypothetical protein R5N44_09635, partial [Streptococcus pyogenes]